MPISVRDRIDRLVGNEDFKRLAHDLSTYAENMHAHPQSTLCLPNFLFATAPGCGASTHLHLFADLLRELELIHPNDEHYCFEWVLGSDAFHSNGSFDRLVDALNHMAGFRGHFCGVVGVDVDAWCDHPDDELDRLLLLADDLQRDENTVMVYFIDLNHKDKCDRLMQRLSCYSPIETVIFEAPSPDQMVVIFNSFVRRRGFIMQLGDKDLLVSAMEQLAALPNFDGMQTLANIADEVLYRWLTSGKQLGKRLPQALVLQLIERYIHQFGRDKSEHQHIQRVIGFRGRP